MKKTTKAPSNNRTIYIDVLRAIAIILVLVGHISYQGFNTSILHRWIYSFHIPLFFFVSGMTAVYTNYSQISLKTKFLKRFYRIYLPFLVWAILYSLSTVSPNTIPFILYGSHNSLMSVSNSSLWFLPTFFLTSVIFDLILLYTTKKNLQSKLFLIIIPLFLLTLILPSETGINNPLGCTGLPFGISILPMALIFTLFGFFFEKYRIRIKKSLPIILKLIIIAISLLVTTYFALNNNDTNYVLMAENRYGNILYFYIAAIFGITASTFTALLFVKLPKKLYKPLFIIGTNTLVIFAFQRYPLSLMAQLLELLPFQHIPSIMLAVLTIIIVLPICLFISLFIKKHLPALAGTSEVPTKSHQA